jgi:hypothetical protein
VKRSFVTLAVLLVLTVEAFFLVPSAEASEDSLQSVIEWQSPPDDLLEVLHAPQLPWVWTAPTVEYLLLVDPVLYPSLAELAAPMHKLAGMRVNPTLNSIHGRHGGTSPRLVEVEGGATHSSHLAPWYRGPQRGVYRGWPAFCAHCQ